MLLNNTLKEMTSVGNERWPQAPQQTLDNWASMDECTCSFM